MVEAPAAALQEPLVRPAAASRKLLPRGCTQCLWNLSRYGLPTLFAHPLVIRIIIWIGWAMMVLLLGMDEEVASLLMLMLVLFSVLCLLGLQRVIDKMIALEGPSTWEGVRQADADVHTRTVAHFEEACANHQHQYPVRLSVLEVYNVENPLLEGSFQDVQAELVSRDQHVQRLYHGTSAFAVRQVVEGGFELPPRAGMFGKGIYFADTPLKSWQYSTVGFMLVCDVALGRQKQAFQGDRSLTLESLNMEYDSVVGMTQNQGGTLRLPEWVVYRPTQAIPRLVLWVCKADEEEVVRRNLRRDARIARIIANFIFMTFGSISLSGLAVILIGAVMSYEPIH